MLNFGGDYEVAPASATTALGTNGATGDFIAGLLCVVTTAATSQVQLRDGASGTPFMVLPNNVGGGVGTYSLPIGLTSRSGAWYVIAAAGVSVVAIGKFSNS